MPDAAEEPPEAEAKPEGEAEGEAAKPGGPADAETELGVRPRAWVEIDINNTREAYQLAKDFVAARNLAYSLTSDRLEMLGGSEKKRVKDVAPLAVQNFISLCTGHKGT